MPFRFSDDPERDRRRTLNIRRATQPVVDPSPPPEPLPEPVPQPPAPTPTPEMTSQLERTLGAVGEAEEVGEIEQAAGRYSKAAMDHFLWQRERHNKEAQAAQAQTEENQREQMDALITGFSPKVEDMPPDMRQGAYTAAAMQNRPPSEVMEEWRRDEGSRRVRDFRASIETIDDPVEKYQLGLMSIGLQKEGLSAAEYQKFIGGLKDGTLAVSSGQVYELQQTPDGQQAWNRQEGLDQTFTKAQKVFDATFDSDLETIAQKQPDKGLQGDPLTGAIAASGIPTDQVANAIAVLNPLIPEGVGSPETAIGLLQPIATALSSSTGTDIQATEVAQLAIPEEMQVELLRAKLTQEGVPPENIEAQIDDLRQGGARRLTLGIGPIPIPLGPLQREAPGFGEGGILGAIRDTLTPTVKTEPLGSFPVGGESLERSAEALTTPLGGAFVAAAPVAAIGGEVAAVAGGTVARELGAPTGVQIGAEIGAGIVGGAAAEAGVGRFLTRGRVPPPVADVPAGDVVRGAPLEPTGAAVRGVDVEGATQVLQRKVTTGDFVAKKNAPDQIIGRVRGTAKGGTLVIEPVGGGRNLIRGRTSVVPVERAGGEAAQAAPIERAVGEVVEEVPTSVTHRIGQAAEGEDTLFHGTTKSGAEGIQADGAIRPTEAGTGTFPGIYLHETEDFARISARTSAKLADEAADVVPVAIRRDLKLATEADELAARETLGIRGSTAEDMTRLTAGLRKQGFDGIELSQAAGETVSRRKIIFPTEDAAPSVGRAQPPSEAFPTTDLSPLRATVARSNNAVRKAQEAVDAAPKGQKGAAQTALRDAKKTHRDDFKLLKDTDKANQTAIKNRGRMAQDIGRAEGSAAQKRTAADVKATVRAEKTAKAGELIRDVLKEDYPLVQKLRNTIRTAARVRPGVKAEIAAGRRGQAGRLEQAISQARERGLTGEDALRFQQKALRGELPRGEFDIPTSAFSPEEQERLIRGAEDVLRAQGLTFEAGRIRATLIDKVFTGDLTKLQNNEISLLARVFDGDFALDIMEKIGQTKPRGWVRRTWDEVEAAIHFPRNVAAGLWDVSALLRQGGFMGLTQTRTWRRNAAEYFQVFVSAEHSAARSKQLLEAPETAFLQEQGLHMPLPGTKAAFGELEEVLLGRGEEAFLGRLLDEAPEAMLKKVGIPEKPAATIGRLIGTRGASDGMVVFLSGLRKDTAMNLLVEALPRQARRAYFAADDAGKVGILREAVSEADTRAVTSFVNSTTGRGSLGPLNPIARVMSLPFFAPRFVAGMVTRFGPALNPATSPAVRRLLLRELGRYYGTTATILGAVGLAGWKVGGDVVSVEYDPRSTDFGKVKIGPTRIDITSGAQPLLRSMVQIATGQRKDALGDIRDIDRTTAAANILRSKMAPTAGFGWTLNEGENFIGEDVSLTNPASYVPDLLTPIVVQDITEAVKEQGALGLPLGMLSLAGLGIVSYNSPSVRTKEFIHEAFMTGAIDPTKYDAFVEENDTLPERIGALLPEDKRILRQLHPDTFEALEKLTEETVGEIGQRQLSAVFRDVSERGREILLTNVTGAAGLLKQTGNGKQFRETTTDAILQQRGLREALQAEFDALDIEQKKQSGPVWDDLNNYFDIFDKYPNASFDPANRDDMLDEIERYFASIGPDREAAVEANLGLDLKEVPEYAQMRLDQQTIRDAGWFDLGDQAWNLLRGATTAPLPDSKREYETELFKQTNAEAPYLKDAIRDQDPFLKTYTQYKGGLRDRWIAKNRHLLLLLDRWGYRELAASDAGPGVSGDTGAVQPVRPVTSIGIR